MGSVVRMASGSFGTMHLAAMRPSRASLTKNAPSGSGTAHIFE